MNISEPQNPKKEQIMRHKQSLYTGAPWEEAIDKNIRVGAAWRVITWLFCGNHMQQGPEDHSDRNGLAIR